MSAYRDKKRDRTIPLKFAPYCKTVCLEYPMHEGTNYLEYGGCYWEGILYNFLHDNEEIYAHIIELDTDVGMTADIIRISFKYETPDDVIENICNQAIQFMLKATQPAFSVGQTAIFNTHDSDLIQHNNSEVEIHRILTDEECDIDDVGFMYEVTRNGEIFEAYQDELTEKEKE